VGVSAGAQALREDGYRFVTAAPTTAADYDQQQHVNNAAVVRLLNDLRIAYVNARLVPRFVEHLRDTGRVHVARELHVLYESEGLPDERFVGGARVAARHGRAGIMEERIVEETTGRPVARAWLVQLLVEDGHVVDYPDWYWDLVAAAEGGPVRVADAPVRRPWGPPS
jgi:acyl-CoA thioesterase FadM